MSISIIYHGFGAVNYSHRKTECNEGCLFFHIRKREKRCAVCHGYRVAQKGRRERLIQTVPIGWKLVFQVENRRLFCHDCGALRHEALDIADPKVHYDQKLERYEAHPCRKMAVQDVAGSFRSPGAQ